MEVCLLAACLVNTALRHYRGTRDATSRERKKIALGTAGNTDNWAVETDERMKCEKGVDTKSGVSSWCGAPTVEMQTTEENHMRETLEKKLFDMMPILDRVFSILLTDQHNTGANGPRCSDS